MKLINLTGSPVLFWARMGLNKPWETISIPPEPKVARFVNAYQREGSQVFELPQNKSSFIVDCYHFVENGTIVNLPPEQDDDVFIVSDDVRLAVPSRNDVASPCPWATVETLTPTWRGLVFNKFVP